MNKTLTEGLFVKVLGILIIIILFFQISLIADEPTVTVIKDISSWRHQVKNVFAGNKVILTKVELYCGNKYPVFYVDFPYDPQSSAAKSFFDKLYLEILQANGQWNYALQSDRDGIRIEINWDRTNKTLTENIVPLENEPLPHPC